MAAQTTPQKVLRVAVIQGVKIIDERHLRHHENVTVGQDGKNTFILPTQGLPKSFAVIEYKNHQYSLVFTEQMDGRVRLGNADVDFASLKTQGLATKRGNEYVLPLNESSKGKVVIGEITLLFQFVAAPLEPARPELPPNIKGSVWQSMDHFFFTILAASLFVHFSGASYIACRPRPADPELSLEQLPDRFAKVMMPAKVEPTPAAQAQAGGDQIKAEKKSDGGGKKDAGPKPGGGSREGMQKAVASKGLLKILGSAGGGGAFEDVLGAGTGSGDVASALAGAAGVSAATADAIGAGGGRKGGGSGSVAGIGELGTSGGGNVNLGSKGDVKVAGRVMDAAPEVESAEIDREGLARYIRQRKSAIQNCYERELKRNPSLRGKVVVRFSITPAGRAAEIDIEENTLGSDAVASCIRTVVRTWVFPFKPDSDVAVAYPFVFSPAS